jgi:hypothetical protein
VFSNQLTTDVSMLYSHLPYDMPDGEKLSETLVPSLHFKYYLTRPGTGILS